MCIMSCVMWYEGTTQLLSVTEFVLAFVLAFILLVKEGRKLEYLEKTPDDELQKMPHTKAGKFKL